MMFVPEERSEDANPDNIFGYNSKILCDVLMNSPAARQGYRKMMSDCPAVCTS